MKTKALSTYERRMQDPEFRKIFEKEYKELILEELLLAISAGDEKSVRLLAKEAVRLPTSS